MSCADFPGPSTSNAEGILICDLDGTLLSINSFPRWVTYLLKGRFSGLSPLQRVLLSGKAAAALASRKAGLVHHTEFKQRLQRLWRQALAADAERTALYALVAGLALELRPNVKGLLARVQDTRLDAILATAAAEEYATALGAHLGFREVLATSSPDNRGMGGGIWKENSRAHKRDGVLALLAQRGWAGRKRVFLTDHEEDLALIRECQVVLWFGETKDVVKMRAAAPGVLVIACRELSDGEVLAAVERELRA